MAQEIETSLRCFIAIEIPEPIKTSIGEVIDILKKHDADVKWIPLNNLHITLKFLGSTPAKLLPKITEGLFNIVLSYNPFYIKIYTTGVFPNKKYPKIIWIGVEKTDILEKLKNDIENVMFSLGFKKENKEFKPHLTIGRVRSQKGILNLVNELYNLKEKDFGTISVKKIKLMKSELKPKGAEYSCINEIFLSTGN